MDAALRRGWRPARTVGGYRVEIYVDFTTWLLGVNVMPLYMRLPPVQLPPSLYVHVGPVIVGFYGAPP